MSVMCALEFYVFDLGFWEIILFRIAEVVKMGLQEVRLAMVTVFFFFSVLPLFVS